MPTIRVDDEVYEWLKSQATPFEDNPNSVLRRVAELDSEESVLELFEDSQSDGAERLSGRVLNDRWGVGARHALYHRDGTFYENLQEFPGALFDPNGYVVFEHRSDYERCSHLRIGKKLNVPEGISAIPGYQRMND